jgi:tryptophan-rich sensory protein
MKNIIRNIILVITLDAIISYLLGVFINADFNFIHWGAKFRAGVVVFMVVTILIILVVMIEDKIDPFKEINEL